MSAVNRFDWTSPEYAEAFNTLLQCSGERPYVNEKLKQLFSAFPKSGYAVDWGAGSGDLTRQLLDYFAHVYAIEPSTEMRQTLVESCPKATVLGEPMLQTTLPHSVDVALISHVFYHIPDDKWGAYITHAAKQLSDKGILCVTLKDPTSGCNQMLEHFGAARFDLYQSLTRTLHLHREFDFTFSRVPGSIKTQSFADTLSIARFMLCDRDADAFSRPPTEQQFQHYVREHFWQEQSQSGGWDYDVVFCFVGKNPLMTPVI